MLNLHSSLQLALSSRTRCSAHRITASFFSTSSSSLSPKSIPPPPHPIFSSTDSTKKPRLAHITPILNTHATLNSKTKFNRNLQAEFNQLAPLEQIRQALSKPRPTSCPRLETSILDAAYKITAGEKIDESSIPPDFPFCSIKQLAYYGDRLWSEVVAGVSLAMRQRKDEKNKGSAGLLAQTTAHLVSDVLAARLAIQLGLKAFYKVGTGTKPSADIWEAYLAALYLEKGREVLLDFLVPIVKSENKMMQELMLEIKAEKRKVSGQPEPTYKQFSNRLKRMQVELTDQISQTVLVSCQSIEAPESPLLPVEGFVLSQTSAVKVTKPTKEEERLQILSLPKLEPIFFASLETARLEFRSKLESLEIPHLLTISPSYRRAELQLPGVPQVAVKIKKKSINDERILTKLMKEVVGLGHFELPKPKLPFNPFVFANLEKAQSEFFGQISARNLKVVHGKSAKGGRRTLTLPGCPPIIAEGKTKAEHRRAFVVGAIKLGVIKLKSAAAPSP